MYDYTAAKNSSYNNFEYTRFVFEKKRDVPILWPLQMQYNESR
jgi:hypothetical protein